MAASPLDSVHILEKDTRGEVLWVWSYPAISPALRDLITTKCTLSTETEREGEGEGEEEGEGGLTFSFGHIHQTWYYLSNVRVGVTTTLPRVTSLCIVILAKEFNPEKYEHLGSIFGATYTSTGTPVTIVKQYLSVVTRGHVTSPPPPCQSFSIKDYDIRKAYVACSLKGLVQQFGVESILIYTAILLKKRIVVYAAALGALLSTCRTIPLFVWHRQNWAVVYPHMALEHEGEMEELGRHGTYVAGFLEPAVQARTDLYDLFVNVPAGSITVAPHAKDSFMMTKLHKDIAMHMMDCAQSNEYADTAVVKEMSKKTKELISNVKGLAPEGGKVSLEILHKRKMNPATETFLFSLASAEDLTEL